MLLSDAHRHQPEQINEFITHAFELNKGKWQGEFINGNFFQLKYTYGILFISTGETSYDLGHNVKAIGHDSKSRPNVKLPEILDYVQWYYDADSIWHT